MMKPDPIKNPYSDEDYATIKNAWTALSKGYDAVSGLLSPASGIPHSLPLTQTNLKTVFENLRTQRPSPRRWLKVLWLKYQQYIMVLPKMPYAIWLSHKL